MANEVVLGIDFGTSYTSAGALVADRVELVQDCGDTVVPSVVYVPPRGGMEVGRLASMRQMTDPAGVVRSIKRLLGVAPGSPEVKRYAASAQCRIDSAGDRVALALRSGPYAPEQIAGAILQHIRALAERRFGGRITKAVITMCACPPVGYRDAITRAAKIAGLDVLEVVAEPVAGALALGLHGQATERKLLVCDFGGGTFDVSAVVQSGLKFTAVSTFGDPYLGGDDLDAALAEGVAGMVVRATGYDMHKDAVRWGELAMRCEAAKRQLSTAHAAPLTMRDACFHAGSARDVEVILDRAWAEAQWEGLFERARSVIDETLRRASWSTADVDRVALIGGSSLVPRFRKMLGEMVAPDRVIAARDAEVAVAVGATLLTARFAAERRPVPVPELVMA